MTFQKQNHECKIVTDNQGNEICLACENLQCRPVKINQLKKLKEQFFKMCPDNDKVYIVNHYNREDKTFTCENFETGIERYIKANRTVYIGFTY